MSKIIKIKREHRKNFKHLCGEVDIAQAGFRAACVMLKNSHETLFGFITREYPETIGGKWYFDYKAQEIREV